MGVCFSKKREEEPCAPPDPAAASAEPKIPIPKEKKSKKKNDANANANASAAAKEETTPKEAKPPPQIEKKPVFVVTQTPKKKSPATSQEEKKPSWKPTNPVELNATTSVFVSLPKPTEEPKAAVRTSGCTKEEVDAILIQCGRLSRSSSGKASGDTLARKYSGSKRSFDFDNEKSRDEEDDWDQKQQHQQQSTRSSPRRRTPSRERSGSRERGSQRRVSRSPGRRPEGTAAGAAAFSCDKTKQQQQPAKMVSVPAREKGVAGGAANATAAVNCRRNASPRSRSPANPTRASNENAMMAQQPQPSLSRSSSRKQEQSPYRRSPMAEVDENLIKGNNNGGANKSQKTQLQTHTQRNSSNPVVTNCVRDQLMSCRAKEKQQSEPEIVEEPKDPKGNHPTVTRSRSSRRSSRDFDHILGLNPENTPFSLPACVSKACSILEAVADLNSSSSDQTNNENGRFGQRGLNSKDAFVESEMEVKDDLTEPSLHKYVSGEDMEPQESAGSNSVGGQPWMSNWEMNSVDSTDRYWTSQSNEEVEDTSKVEGRGSTLRSGGSSSNTFAGSATGSSSKKREVEHRRQVHRGRVSGGSGKVGGSGRAYSAPVAAAASS